MDFFDSRLNLLVQHSVVRNDPQTTTQKIKGLHLLLLDHLKTCGMADLADSFERQSCFLNDKEQQSSKILERLDRLGLLWVEYSQKYDAVSRSRSSENLGDHGSEGRPPSASDGENDVTEKQKPAKPVTVIRAGKTGFLCTINNCNKTFCSAYNLKRHILREHTKKSELPFACKEPGCGKAFGTQWDLSVHSHIHKARKPFACSCGKRYSRHSSLRDHQKMTGHPPDPNNTFKTTQGSRSKQNKSSKTTAATTTKSPSPSATTTQPPSATPSMDKAMKDAEEAVESMAVLATSPPAPEPKRVRVESSDESSQDRENQAVHHHHHHYHHHHAPADSSDNLHTHHAPDSTHQHHQHGSHPCTNLNFHNTPEHKHGPDCGHTFVLHDGHADLLIDNVLHHHHGDSCEQHLLDHVVPDQCSPVENSKCHQHGPNCGHEAIFHGDHYDYLVDGVLHHHHNGHCDQHGSLDILNLNDNTKDLFLEFMSCSCGHDSPTSQQQPM